MILQYITGVSLYYVGDYNELSFNPHQIKTFTLINDFKLEESIYQKYKYRHQIDKLKVILFFDADLSRLKVLTNYKKDLLELIKKIKKRGYYIVNKGHPRIGTSEIIKPFIDEEIPNYIPAEFIDVESFCYVVGILSLSIANLAKNYDNVFSVIEEFEFISEKDKLYYKDFLKQNSYNRLKYFSNIEHEI